MERGDAEVDAKVRDLRRYSKQTQTRVVLGFLLILFLIGDGLIWWLMGSEAGVFALSCTVVGLAPVLLVVFGLGVIEWLVRRARDG